MDKFFQNFVKGLKRGDNSKEIQIPDVSNSGLSQNEQKPNCFRKFLITNDMSHILFSLHRKDNFYQQAIDILPEMDNNDLKFLIQKLITFCKAPVTKPDNESDDEYRDRLSQLIIEITKYIK